MRFRFGPIGSKAQFLSRARVESLPHVFLLPNVSQGKDPSDPYTSSRKAGHERESMSVLTLCLCRFFGEVAVDRHYSEGKCRRITP